MISPGNISQGIWMINLLSEPEVGRHFTIIIHTEVFWVFPQLCDHTYIYVQQQLLQGGVCVCVFSHLFNRGLWLLSCTAF